LPGLSEEEKKERIKELDEIEETNKPIFRKELVEFHEIKKKERIKELDEVEKGKLLLFREEELFREVQEKDLVLRKKVPKKKSRDVFWKFTDLSYANFLKFSPFVLDTTWPFF
jgi:hypothetical protein